MSAILQPIRDVQARVGLLAEADVDWKAIVIASTVGVYALETYLTLRQYPLYNKKSPPEALADSFTPEVFAKSQRYGKDKARFSLISSTLTQILEVALLYYNAQVWAWSAAGNILDRFGYTGYEIPQSILFIAILVLSSSIPTLPLELYKTFVLEQKHGFNKMTIGLFFADLVKGWAVGLAIGGPFLAAFLWIMRKAGDSFLPWLMSFLIVFQMIMVVLYPLVIQPLFNTLTPLPEGPLRQRIEALAGRLNFPLKHLYVIDGSKRSSHSNAYFFGLPWSKHIVIFDTLINQSKPEEIEAVVAHELGHWSCLHPTKLLVVSQVHLFILLSLFPAFLKSSRFVSSFGFPPSVTTPHPPTLVAFMLFQAILTPFEALFSLGMNAISRQFEWEADRFALDLGHGSATEEMDEHANDGKDHSGDMGERLARALIGLHAENLSTIWVDWLYSAWHYTHPTLTERLKAMDDYRVKHGAKKIAAGKKKDL